MKDDLSSVPVDTDNVDKTIESNIEKADREASKIRLQMIKAVIEILKKKGWSQEKAAKILGVTQPRISNLRNEKVDKFSIEFLVKMLMILGYTFDFSHTSTDKKVKKLRMEIS